MSLGRVELPKARVSLTLKALEIAGEQAAEVRYAALKKL